MLNISCTEQDGIRVLSVYGRVDHASSVEFEKKIFREIEAGHKFIIIDCANFNYMSSSGLRVLLVALKNLESRHGYLALSNIPPHVYQVIETSGFNKIFHLMDTVQTAIKTIHGLQQKTG